MEYVIGYTFSSNGLRSSWNYVDWPPKNVNILWLYMYISLQDQISKH